MRQLSVSPGGNGAGAMATLQTRSTQRVAAGWVSLDPSRHAGGDARHQGIAGDGDAQARTKARLKL